MRNQFLVTSQLKKTRELDELYILARDMAL